MGVSRVGQHGRRLAGLLVPALAIAAIFAASATGAWAQGSGCDALPKHDAIAAALQKAVQQGQKANGGFGHIDRRRARPR